MPATIKDIANKTGVACSTVSRVINGKGSISQETKDKIFEAMKELNYHPNSLARNLANGSTYALGLVIDANDEKTFSNTFFNRSIFAIEKVAQKYDYNLLITNYSSSIGTANIEKLIYEKRVDGLLIPPSVLSKEVAELLSDNNFPFIILGQMPQYKCKCSWVDIDNKNGSQLAAQHLIQNNYLNISFICNNCATTFGSDRINGYKNALRDYGIGVNDDLIVMCNDETTDCYQKVLNLLKSSSRPDAFICSNNILAFNTIKAVKDFGLSIPQDIGIITFDNYPIAEFTDPPLTTVDVDTYALGEQAARILIKKINKEVISNQHILISPDIIIRKSTQRN